MTIEKVYKGEESPRQEKDSDVANSLPSRYWDNNDDDDKFGDSGDGRGHPLLILH